MKEKHSSTSIVEALGVIVLFWRTLLAQAGARKLLAASCLTLLSGLSEGAVLLFLIPLVQSLDTTSGVVQGPTHWMPQALQHLGWKLNLPGVLALFLCVAFARAVLRRQSALYLNALKLNFLRDTQVELYSAIAHAKWSYLRRERPADLLAALTTETDRLNSAVFFALQLPGQAVMIAAHLIAASLISPTLTCAALGIGFLLAWSARGRLTESLRLGHALSSAYQDYHHLVYEFLAGMKITKCYVAEDQHVTAFTHSVDEVRNNIFCFTRNHANARLIQEIAAASSVAVFLGVSAGLMHEPISRVLVLALILYRLLPLVQEFQLMAQQLLHMSPAAQTILALSRACATARETSIRQPQQVFRLRREIRFENVSFRHGEKDREVLADINLRLPLGTLTVLSGASGVGKSTLLDLLAGLLRPNQGKISIDDSELTDELAPAWRASVAYVLQDPFLFHATIRANLLVAKPDAAEDELLEALSLAGARNFVEALPQRMETIVGDRGARFSGGERQRLALARALLRQPALLIMDEPTSSLDAHNEQMVLEGIEALKGRLTMILVTHRPDYVAGADQVVRLEKEGLRVIEMLR